MSRAAVLVTCLQEVSHDHSHVIPFRALSPHWTVIRHIRIYICKHRCNKGITSTGEAVWGIERIAERKEKGGASHNSRAKGQWGKQRLTPKGDHPAIARPTTEVS